MELAIGLSIFAVLLIIIVLVAAKFKKDDQPRTHMPITERRGIEGEFSVDYGLSKLIYSDEYMLTNLLLPLKNGHKTEVDNVLITRKGIFCIEIKNWVGRINGDHDSDIWYQIYDDPTLPNRTHPNPVKQNQVHCAILNKILNKKYDIYNIVIFKDLEPGSLIESPAVLTISQFACVYKELENIFTSFDLVKINEVIKQYKPSEQEYLEYIRTTRARKYY